MWRLQFDLTFQQVAAAKNKNYFFLQLKTGAFGTLFNVSLSDHSIHVCLTALCSPLLPVRILGIACVCTLFVYLCGTALQHRSTKVFCDNSEETNLYHWEFVPWWWMTPGKIYFERFHIPLLICSLRFPYLYNQSKLCGRQFSP